MTTETALKYSQDGKSIEFTLSGYSEEMSMKLVQDILKSVTQSEYAPKENRRITIPAEQMKSLKKMKQPETKPEPECPMEKGRVYDLVIEKKQQPIAEVDNSPEDIDTEVDPEKIKALFNIDNQTFQAYYVCKCGDRGKHFIKRSRIHVNCKKCGKRMQVRDASIHGFPHKDDFGNTYIAGEFRRTDEVKYGAVFS